MANSRNTGFCKITDVDVLDLRCIHIIIFVFIWISGRTMLDLACYNGYTECVETLLLQGSTILVHDNITRRTPLHAAGKLYHYFILQGKCLGGQVVSPSTFSSRSPGVEFHWM